METKKIEAKNLEKQYVLKEKTGLFRSKNKKIVQAVKGVSLEIPKGKIVGVLGINGAGKTTTIRMLASIIEPTAGEITMNGIDAVKNHLWVKERINVVSGGERNLYWRLTASENLKYFGSLYGVKGMELKEKIASLKPEDTHKYPLIQDLIDPLDLVILVVPIDKAAPKGRLILPQQQTIRDILERGALSLVVRDTELKSTLDHFLAQGVCPKLVVTDSQAFARVSKAVPENITLTSFSILFSRYKGELETQLKGIAALSSIEDGDRILIAEGCTHHRQCGDIGTCKIPNWIRNYTGKKPVFEFTSGTEFPDDVSSYKMVVHCGGCMLNEREMKYRIACCQDQGVPITNYGILIAQVTGILKRSLGPFPEMQKLI